MNFYAPTNITMEMKTDNCREIDPQSSWDI